MAKKSETSKFLKFDAPIIDESDDRLGRAPLARHIAAQIKSTPGSQTIVLAINAPWGAGKTSFVNLIEKALDESFEIVRYNPWHYQSEEAALQGFYLELGAAMTRPSIKKSVKKILKPAGTALSLFANVVSVVNPIAGAATAALGGAAKRAGSTATESVASLKTTLSKALRDGAQRFVVLIDDIDRLDRDTIRTLVKTIRLNADFPNVTYVLAYDRDIVERCLNEQHGILGRDYLEKIVQVTFDLPAPTPARLADELKGDVLELLSTIGVPVDDRVEKLFDAEFATNFHTLRQISRYINGLRITLPMVARDVDVADFLVVEMIRTFHGSLYQTMSESRLILAPTIWEAAASARGGADDLDQWRQKNITGDNKNLANVLAFVCPAVRQTKQKPFGDRPTIAEPQYSLRLTSSDSFDRYFQLAVRQGDVTEEDIDTFITQSSSEDSPQVGSSLGVEPAQLTPLLRRTSMRVVNLNSSQATALLCCLLRNGDDLLWRRTFKKELMHAFDDLVDRVIEKIDTTSLSAALESAVREGQLHTSIALVMRLSDQRQRNEDRLQQLRKSALDSNVAGESPERALSFLVNQIEQNLLSDDHFRQLRKTALDKLDEAAKKNCVWEATSTVTLVKWWGELAQREPEQLVAAHTKSDDDFLLFLKHSASEIVEGHELSTLPILEQDILPILPDALIRLRGMADGNGSSADDARAILQRWVPKQ